jgi:predicted ArsR family transcriptional regulator
VIAVDPEPRVHRALADDSRVRLLGLLRDEGTPRSSSELAERIGLHPTTVRTHLEVLVDAGLATAAREVRRVPGRPRVLYSAVAQVPESQDGYRLLAEILSSELAASAEDPSARAAAAGAAWGRFLVSAPEPFADMTAARGRSAVVALLARLGFAPEVSAGGAQIRLRRCPFIDVAREHADVVCAVHLGLMRGALAALDAPLEVEELVPFAEPDACSAHLGPARSLDS